MHEVIEELKTNKLLRFQSIVFFFLSLSLIVTNGLRSCWWGECGIYVGQWHMHDAFWHISLVKSAFSSFPFSHPFFAGENVFGYNYFIDLILFGLTKIGLEPFFAFFRFLPVVISLLYIFMAIKFAKLYFKTSTVINSVIFFLFFGSSLSYLATLYAGNTFFYSSMRGFPVVTSIQPGMMFLNLQFALSLALILATLVLFKTSTKYLSLLWLTILMFSISGLKFYGGIVLSMILGGMIAYRIYQRDKVVLRIAQIIAIIIGDLLARSLFYSRSGGDGFPFAFWPFALPHVLLDDPILFNNHSWTLARYFLYEKGGWRSPRLIALESYTVFLLAIMNFGTRLIGILALFIGKIRKTLGFDDFVIIGTIIFTFAMPVFFTQDGGWFNTMQFLYYGVFFASIYAGRVLGHLAVNKSIFSKIIVGIIVILTIPNCIEQLRYLTAPQNLIPDSEVAVLNELSKRPGKVVYISGPELKNAIVPALSGKTAYYLDVDQLMVTHLDYQERQKQVKDLNANNILDLPVDFYYLYKTDEGSPAQIETLSHSNQVHKLAETDHLIIFER